VLTRVFFIKIVVLIFLNKLGALSEPIEKLVKRELLIFKKYQLDVKDIKRPFQWCQKHEAMFSTIGFLVQHIFGVVVFQIEIEIFFLWLEFLLTLKDVNCKLKV
jgi:hypothetical protein